jgi:ribosomal protein L11 methyltransferase
MNVWRKIASPKWEDAWEERLAGFGPGRVMLVRNPAHRFMRIEVWDVNPAEGRSLVRQFGGKIVSVDSDKAIARGLERPGPIRIRGRLTVLSSPGDLPPPGSGKNEKRLIVPSGLAFGTGAHPTTATCLRLLSDLAQSRAPEPWEMIDIGTGTGILAMAGRLFGARRVSAFDNDPAAVRVAKESIRLNRLGNISVARKDVTLWAPEHPVAVVVANLFHEILIRCAGQIAAAVAADGALIISGILRGQEGPVLAEMKGRGLAATDVRVRGKWVTALLRWSPERRRDDRSPQRSVPQPSRL